MSAKAGWNITHGVQYEDIQDHFDTLDSRIVFVVLGQISYALC